MSLRQSYRESAGYGHLTTGPGGPSKPSQPDIAIMGYGFGAGSGQLLVEGSGLRRTKGDERSGSPRHGWARTLEDLDLEPRRTVLFSAQPAGVLKSAVRLCRHQPGTCGRLAPVA